MDAVEAAVTAMFSNTDDETAAMRRAIAAWCEAKAEELERQPCAQDRFSITSMMAFEYRQQARELREGETDHDG